MEQLERMRALAEVWINRALDLRNAALDRSNPNEVEQLNALAELLEAHAKEVQFVLESK